MARYLHLLPRRKFRVNVFQLPFDLILQTRDLLDDVQALAIAEVAKLFKLALKSHNRLFKI